VSGAKCIFSGAFAPKAPDYFQPLMVGVFLFTRLERFFSHDFSVTCRYSSDVIWYTQTMNTLIILASSNIPDHVITNIMAVIDQTIAGKDEEERKTDVDSLTKICWNCVKNREIPDALLRIASWVGFVL
jgi:hypothetical protein